MSQGLVVALTILAAATTLGAAPGAGPDRRAAASPSASQNAVAPAKPESEPADIRLAWRGYLFVGGSMASLASLDERLEAAGRPGVPSEFLTFGAGGQAVAGRLVLGAEAAGMFQGSAEGPRGRQALSAVTGFFDLGYILRAGGKMSMSIMLGIGAGAASLRLNAAPAPAFDDILRSSGGRLRLAAYGFLLQPALAVDIWPGRDAFATPVPIRRRFRGRSLFFFGVRAAYAIAPGRTRWELGYDEAAGGPDARLTGPSLRLVAGWGSR